MDQRDARRRARQLAAEHLRELVYDQCIDDPDDLARMNEALTWLADYIAPTREVSVPPANLRPLVRPDGTELPEWRGPDAAEQPPAPP